MKKIILATFFAIFFAEQSFANPIISGISTNEVNIDTKFLGAEILLFGAKGDAGNIIIAVRGPKKNFMVTKKQKLLGIWYNGERMKIKETHGFYSLFSTFGDQEQIDNLLTQLELGKNNLPLEITAEAEEKKKDEFRLQLIDQLEKSHLYTDSKRVDFLDETLFKVMLDFPKNISRGVYTVEIYLINEGALMSFQSIPIYVNQVGFSAQILDFAYQEPFLYGILAVVIALVVGFCANYLFVRFFGK